LKPAGQYFVQFRAVYPVTGDKSCRRRALFVVQTRHRTATERGSAALAAAKQSIVALFAVEYAAGFILLVGTGDNAIVLS
jgi:hypothetical protein